MFFIDSIQVKWPKFVDYLLVEKLVSESQNFATIDSINKRENFAIHFATFETESLEKSTLIL